MQDTVYREFNCKIVRTVNIENMIGVRSPQMKMLVKEFAKDDDKYLFLSELPHQYYEENNLHAAIVSSISKDINVVMKYVEEFLPYIDNWATCDCFSPKIFKKYPDLVYEKIQQWIKSNHTYTVRFGIVSLLQFFLDDNFKPEINDLVLSVKSDEYYINIAIAWYFSYALIKQWDASIYIIENKIMSKWLHNKSIQKAVESFRITDDRKEYLKSLRIK